MKIVFTTILKYPALVIYKNFVQTWESFEIKKVKQITTQFNFALNFAKNHIYFPYKKVKTEQTKYLKNLLKQKFRTICKESYIIKIQFGETNGVTKIDSCSMTNKKGNLTIAYTVQLEW